MNRVSRFKLAHLMHEALVRLVLLNALVSLASDLALAWI
jgi:hypothetical protein